MRSALAAVLAVVGLVAYLWVSADAPPPGWPPELEVPPVVTVDAAGHECRRVKLERGVVFRHCLELGGLVRAEVLHWGRSVMLYDDYAAQSTHADSAGVQRQPHESVAGSLQEAP